MNGNNSKLILAYSKIEQLTHEIRLDLITLSDNEITKVYDEERGKVQACLYALEDCETVITDYIEFGSFTHREGGYLLLYGLLQALFLQQDAIDHLSEYVLNEPLDFKINHPGLYNIRNIRNITVGHPTKKGGNKYYHLIQTALSNKVYKLHGYKNQELEERLEIDIFELIKTQDTEINIILKQIIKKLKSKIKGEEN